ncbi:MAG: molecular chaperone DnaJ [Clostridiales bacterium]|nr:molecular chaperone DnaJ [Clostridiales bacterium]
MANYYEILGVDKNATQDQIKTQYRKLARQYHPDLHPGDEQAAQKFKEINEANETLSDPEKRKKYDFELENPGMGGFGGFDGGGFGGFGDIFGDIFSSFTGGSAGARSEQNRKGQDITLEVELSFLDAAKGCKREIKYNRNEPCKTCKGTGAKNGTAYETCKTCKGSGQVQYVSGGGFFRSISVKACSDCNGTGRKITNKCTDCGGKGYNKTQTVVTLDIPAGADNNSYMKKRGYGNASTVGGEPGDLIVVFRLLPHKLFKRKNFDLYVEVPISYTTACLGGKVKIPTLDDSYELTIPDGVQSGKTMIVRGKGIKTRNGVGDLYVTIVVEVPSKLSRTAKKALETLEKELDVKSYDKIKKYKDAMDSLYGN